MKKVFLVDDEIVIREGIRDRIEWTKEGFIYCGDAPDGEIALPLIEELHPDILITDIKMPFMDGLELSKVIRHKMPSCKIIILSGHDEFKYARDALRIGVTEYCIKPVSAADLIQLLHQVSSQIDEENKERAELEALKRKMANQFIVTKDKILSDLCYGIISTADAIQASNILKIEILAKYYRVVYMDIDFPDSTQPIETSLLQVEEFIYHSIDNNEFSLHFKRNKKEYIWILKGDQPEEIQETIKRNFSLIKTKAQAAFPIIMTLSFGSVQERLQGICISYAEAEEEKSFQFISRKYQRSYFKATQDSVEHFIYLDRNKIVDFLKLGSFAQTKNFTIDYAACLNEIDWNTPIYGYYLLMDITETILQFTRESYKEKEIIAARIQLFQKKIVHIHDHEDALHFIQEVLECFIIFRESLTDKHSALIQKAKDFITKNYDVVDLSLQMVADEVKVSPGHLSTVFSNETGQTFIEFLTNTRIRKAMELLKSTNAKSYEIAFKVGYNDSHYFSNLFKRTTGMTTKDFRKEGISQGIALLGDSQ
jgi:two-component system response regulator YesN